MRLVERHIVKDNRFEDICLKSGLLYNYVLYNIRQEIFSGNYLKEFDLSNKLCKENQFDFRNLPNHVSQQVIKQVFKNIKSWMRLKKDFEKNPSKYGNHRPHLPSYKRGKKQNMVVFTNCDCRIKDDNHIHFVKNVIESIKTNVKKDELKQVRIIPQATCYVVEVVYERKEADLGLDKDNFLSIDLGLNNLCSCISNVVNSFIFSNALADEAVKKMVNVDGSKRIWKQPEIKDIFEKCGAKKPDKATWGDVQYVFAMYYSDGFPKVFKCENELVKATLMYLDDPDAPEGVAFIRWLAVQDYLGEKINWKDLT